MDRLLIGLNKGEVWLKEADIIEMGTPGECLNEEPFITVRAAKEFAGRGLWLDSRYNWHLGTDSSNCTVLAATRKKQYFGEED